jgi:type IV pilus assembly protein PilE
MNLVYELKREEGFSLTELMIVLVIIGILMLLALPKFMNVITRAKMTEAKMMLKQVHTLQEAYHYERDIYSTDLTAIGFEQSALVSEGGTARYVISIEEGDDTTFAALATAVVDFDGDGTFNVWEVGPDGKILERTPD